MHSLNLLIFKIHILFISNVYHTEQFLILMELMLILTEQILTLTELIPILMELLAILLYIRSCVLHLRCYCLHLRSYYLYLRSYFQPLRSYWQSFISYGAISLIRQYCLAPQGCQILQSITKKSFLHFHLFLLPLLIQLCEKNY